MEQWLTVVAFATLLTVIGIEVWRNCAGEGRCLRRRTLRGRAVGNAPRSRSGGGARPRRLGRRVPRSPRNLSADQRFWYVQQWTQLQRSAATRPATALLDADELLTRLLDDLGYPTGRFAEVAPSLSAPHAAVVDDYRAASDAAFDTRLGLAGTTEIREAVRRFGVVFERLAQAQVSIEVEETAA